MIRKNTDGDGFEFFKGLNGGVPVSSAQIAQRRQTDSGLTGEFSPPHLRGGFADYGNGIREAHAADDKCIKMHLSTASIPPMQFNDVAFGRYHWPSDVMSPSAPNSERTRAALKRFAGQRKITPSGWADSAKVARNTLLDFLKGKKDNISLRTLGRLAEAQDATIAEITGGDLGGETPSAARNRAMKDVAIVRCLEVRAAAGGGFNVVDEPESAPFFFQRRWADQTLGGDYSNLRAIVFKGDSMLPTIRDGDIGIVRVQTTPEEFHSGKVHVLWDGRGVVVKRVEIILSSPPRYRITSDNASLYPPYEVDEMDARIVGPVIWRGGAL